MCRRSLNGIILDKVVAALKLDWNKKYTTVSVYAFLVLSASILFFLVLSNLNPVTEFVGQVFKPVRPVLYGFVVAYLLNPVMMTIERWLLNLKLYQRLKDSQRRAISLFFAYLFAIAMLVVFVLIVLPRVATNIATMYGQLQAYVGAAESYVNKMLEAIPPELLSQEYVDQLTRFAGESIQKLINWLATSAPMLLGLIWQLGSGIISAFIAIIVSIYFLLAKERFVAQLRKLMCAFLNKSTVRRLVSVTRTTHLMFGKFIVGKIVDSMIIGVLCFVGLSIMKMPNAVLVSFIVGVTNVLPYFGPFIGAVPGFLLIAIISPVQGLIFLVFILVLQQIDGNIIGPMVLGDSTGLSAFWVVFAILFFGGIFGIVGMFIGVPTFGVLYALFKENVYEKLKKRGLPTETAKYVKPLDISAEDE